MTNIYDEFTNKGDKSPENNLSEFGGSFDELLASLQYDANNSQSVLNNTDNAEPDFLSAILGEFETKAEVADNDIPQETTARPYADNDSEEKTATVLTYAAVKEDKLTNETKSFLPELPVGEIKKRRPRTDEKKLNEEASVSAPKRSQKNSEQQEKKVAAKKQPTKDAPKNKPVKKRKSSIAPDDVYNEENWEPYAYKLKKSKIKFAFGIAVYTILLAAAAVLGVVYLHNYLDAYEKTRPEYFMEALMPTMSADDWYNLMLENSNVAPSDFETESDIYQAYYNAIVTSDEISYRKKLGLYSDEHPVYAVKIGNTDIVYLYLEEDPSKSAGCGFNYWKLADVEALADGSGLNSASIEINAPLNAQLYLNGVLLTDEYVIDDMVPYQLSELESRFDTQPYKLKYRIDGLYLNFELTDESGNVLEAYKQEGNCLFYDVDQTERWSFKVSAMSDMTVYVNGAQLNTEDAVKTVDYPVLAGLEDYVADIPTTKTWSYNNLLTEPVITCVDRDGNPVEAVVLDDGTYTFGYTSSSEVEEKHKDRAMGFIKAYIKYATDDGNATDTNYYKLVNYVLADSELRDFFYSSYIGGMHWAKILDYEVHDIQVSDFISYGDSCFSCTGYFNITQSTYYETRNYETTYTLVFVKSGGEWYVVRMDDSI